MTLRRAAACLLLAVPIFSLTGCSAGPVEPSSFAGFPYPRMAPGPPPSPVPETPDVPAERWLWLWRPGYWAYDGFAYSWNPGALIPRPDPSAVWLPDRWERRSYGWVFVPGNWQ